MAELIEGYQITRYEFPRTRAIGDSQVYIDMHYIGALELSHRQPRRPGLRGALFYPLPPLAELARVFARRGAPGLVARARSR